MYIKIEFIIILAVFLAMFIVVAGLGWYHLYLKMKGEGAVTGDRKKQQDEDEIEEEEKEEYNLSKADEEVEETVHVTGETKEFGSRFVVELFQEIRVPLNSILALQEQILKADSIGDAKKGALETRHSGEALLSIIDDMLDMASFESGEYVIPHKNYNLEEILQPILDSASAEAHKKGIAFAINIDKQMPVNLLGDERIIRRIFNILINEAVNRTEAGSVYFNLDYQIEEEKVRIIGTLDDTGVGYKQEDMEDIFRPYDNNRHITMGRELMKVNFCKKGLEYLGGSFLIESIYGTGSKCSFEIVQTMEDNSRWSVQTEKGDVFVNEKEIKRGQETREKAVNEQAEQKKSSRILIVDDNIVNVKVITSLLEPYKLQITSVYSGQQCLDEIAKNPDYAVVFLDHMMPGMDGIETFHKLRAMEGEYFTTVPVVALTATVLDNAREVFEKEGFQDYVSKPVNIAEVERVLKKYVHSDKWKEEPVKEEKVEHQEFAIEDVDMSIGLRQWNGNLDKYKMILEVVYTDGKQKLIEMRQYLENSDYEKYMIEAHSAKSVTASIGAMSVSELAKEQEFAVKNQELTIVEAKSGQFLHAYENLLSNIGKSLGIVNKQEEIVEELLAITVEEVEERLEKISGFIDDYEDEEAISQLKDLLRYNIEIYPIDFIKEIIESLNRLDYAKASERIKNRRSEFDEEDIISRR